MTHRPRANAVRLFLVVALFQAATFAVADEASTARRFELAKESEPQLIAFIKDMPKGADLHSHVSGAVYAESRLDAAIDSSLFFDPKTGTFTGNEGPGMVPARDLRTNSALAAQYLDSVSMRGSYPSVKSGHDHFFTTFSRFGVPSSVLSREAQLAEVIGRAEAQNVEYLELMTSVSPDDAYDAAAGNPPPVENLHAALAVMQTRFPALARASKTYLDERDRQVAKLLSQKAPITSTSGPIAIRYIATVYRLSPNDSFFAQMACAMAVAQADKRVIGITILGPEDDVMSRQNFDAQMRMIDFLWQRLGRPKMALHGGELTLECSPVEDMRSRIRKTIELGHARRIGHGVSIAWEDDLAGLLREMKQKHIEVEICLTSNDGILKVFGGRHPFRLYQRAGIPMNLNTDDEGVSRSNLTMEFVRAARTYKLSYRQLKNLARNSIEYSFLPGASLYIGGDYAKLRPEFIGVRNPRWTPGPAAKRLTSASEKLAMQVRLEQSFVLFER